LLAFVPAPDQEFHVSTTPLPRDFDRSETKRLVPSPLPAKTGDAESLAVWGFTDTAFEINAQGHVAVSGQRYDGLSGESLPNLLPWFQSVLQVTLDTSDVAPSSYPPVVPPSMPADAFLGAARQLFADDQIVVDAATRLRHGHGQTQEEMYTIKNGSLGRVPDYVVFPDAESQVLALVQMASRFNVSLIPYGGGTNVTDALRCPDGETRPIVSVDMSRMNRVLWIDPVNRMACIQAGMVGRHIVEALKKHGFTMGHEPDSIEFSTLGGWIATNASGMKKNRYGNIEDIVLDVHVVTQAGKLERSSIAPRESVGLDPRQWLFGSEGNLGIITAAVVKLFPVPAVEHYGSVLFKTFEAGVAFMYAIAQTRRPPASIRLMDNLQFQFGQALKPAATGLKALKSKLEKAYVLNVLGFDPNKMTACTLVFEGSADEVADQERMLYRIAKAHGGMKAGEENGRRGYQLTYGIAYIRDFVMTQHVMAESFETSVPWSQAVALCDNVKKRIYAEHAARKLPGLPFISCRVTQLYDTGVCIYFYFAFYAKGVAHPSEVYLEIEKAARDEVLKSGGSLSHHHGVGKLRQSFMPEIMSPAALAWRQQAKQALDPGNIFGAGNLQNGAPERSAPAVTTASLPPQAIEAL
jgi:alkyldihydroxyacetonephosphate synthase